MINEPKLVIKNLRLTTHAHERITERLKITDKTEALNRVKQLMGNAKYIGFIAGEDGDYSHMYASNKFSIYINPELNAVKTVAESNTYAHYKGLKNKIIEMYETEFRKTDRAEKAILKKLEHSKLRIDADIAILKYKKYKTRSKVIKEECEGRIIQCNNELLAIQNEVREIQINKREIARSMATTVL